MPNPVLLRALASAFLNGDPSADAMVARAEQLLGRDWSWLRPLAERYLAGIGPHPRRRDVVEFLRNDEKFQLAWSKHAKEIGIKEWLADPPRMHGPNWNLPPIETAGDLADFLGLMPTE